jgi:hypothetical protein
MMTMQVVKYFLYNVERLDNNNHADVGHRCYFSPSQSRMVIIAIIISIYPPQINVEYLSDVFSLHVSMF